MLAVKGYYQNGQMTFLAPLPDEEEYKAIGLSSFFETEDDADVDWEDCLGLKDQGGRYPF